MVAFLLLWLALVLQRLQELRVARAHTRELLQAGAYEAAPGHYPLMVLLHTGWFVGWVLEASLSGVHWHCGYWPAALAGQLLRFWARSSLGRRWTTRILVVPGEQPVATGPYRFLAHPNYVGVVLELFAFPMLTGAWRTALAFSLANLALLRWRIHCEEEAWRQATRSGK